MIPTWTFVVGILTFVTTCITFGWMVITHWKNNHDQIRRDIIFAPGEARERAWRDKSDSEIISYLRSSNNPRHIYEAGQLEHCLYNRFVARTFLVRFFN